MRINVYAEELTNDVVFISKQVDWRTFYGIRMFLKSPEALHHRADDDDRSAVTFWVPWRGGKNHHDELRDVFNALRCAGDAAENDETTGRGF